jgi:hypothetical protein
VITRIGIVAGPADDIDEALRFYSTYSGQGTRQSSSAPQMATV